MKINWSMVLAVLLLILLNTILALVGSSLPENVIASISALSVYLLGVVTSPPKQDE